MGSRRSVLAEATEKPIQVAAAILERQRRILICQRHHSDAYGLQWEFPGGKVREGETHKAALARELQEELGIRAEVGEELYRLQHRYPDRYVEVVFFHVPRFQGRITNRVFEDVQWTDRKTLSAYHFLEADRELILRIEAGEIL